MPILVFNQFYTLSEFFELKAEVDDLFADFGYSLNRSRLALHKYAGEPYRLDTFHIHIKEFLSYVF